MNRRDLGETLSLEAGSSLLARVRLNSNVPVDHLEIVNNGVVVAKIPLPAGRTRVDTTVRLPATRSGWYLLRARGDHPVYPILDAYPYATTSPIYVTVGGRPIRSRSDAEYFVAWITRLERGAMAHTDWNSNEEMETVLGTLRRAREQFTRRLAE